MSSFFVKNSLTYHLTRFPRNLWNTRSFSGSCSLNNKNPPEEAIPKNTIEKYYGTNLQPNGEIYDKRPFRMTLKANKKYAWCSCGRSKSQPLCDGAHKINSLKITNEPIIFMVEETKEYWLCNCKQSKHRPFCDGTHKIEDIQTALKHYKM